MLLHTSALWKAMGTVTTGKSCKSFIFHSVLAEELKLGDANIMLLIGIRIFSVQLYSVSIHYLSYYMSITLSWAQGNKKNEISLPYQKHFSLHFIKMN